MKPLIGPRAARARVKGLTGEPSTTLHPLTPVVFADRFEADAPDALAAVNGGVTQPPSLAPVSCRVSTSARATQDKVRTSVQGAV